MQDNTFLFEFNNDDVGINSLVPQLKLFTSLFELKDNDTNDISTIIKKLQDMSRHRHFLITKVENIVRLLLLSQATSTESEGIFSALKHKKAYLRSTMANNRLDELNLITS